VAVRGVRRSGPATLERLRARSAYATGGITLGSAGFGRRTATGLLAAPKQGAVLARSGGYRVRLPAASASLLTIP
jgi:hypothetical protein